MKYLRCISKGARKVTESIGQKTNLKGIYLSGGHPTSQSHQYRKSIEEKVHEYGMNPTTPLQWGHCSHNDPRALLKKKRYPALTRAIRPIPRAPKVIAYMMITIVARQPLNVNSPLEPCSISQRVLVVLMRNSSDNKLYQRVTTTTEGFRTFVCPS